MISHLLSAMSVARFGLLEEVSVCDCQHGASATITANCSLRMLALIAGVMGHPGGVGRHSTAYDAGK